MAKKFTYKTQGTCSKSIEIELEGDIVKSVRFEGGCHGNTQGIGLLTRGMQAADVIARLEGIDCKGRGTSCPDQLAKALRQALSQYRLRRNPKTVRFSKIRGNIRQKMK